RRMAKDHELVDGRHEPPGFAAGTRSVLPAATGRRAEKQSWRRLTVAMSHDLPVPSEATCSFLLFVMCGNDQTGNRTGSPKVAPTVGHHLKSERRLTVYELSGVTPGPICTADEDQHPAPAARSVVWPYPGFVRCSEGLGAVLERLQSFPGQQTRASYGLRNW